MMATAFLGFLRSPKWFKFNFSNNNNYSNSSNNSNNSNNNSDNTSNDSEVITGKNDSTCKDRLRKMTVKHSSIFTKIDLQQLGKKHSDEVVSFIREKNLTPVLVYEDLSINSVKTTVLNETTGLAGVYLILNKNTLDYYIGSASTGKFYARFINHLFNLNGSKVVKSAVKKYKIHNFAFIILELFNQQVNKENNKQLLDLEDFYLKSLLPNYNILTEAGSSFGYKHTEISRIKMTAGYSEGRRARIGNLNRAKAFCEETKQAMSKAALLRAKTIYSAEAIEKMKKNSRGILAYNLDRTLFGQFPSMKSASESLGCNQKTITRALQTPKKILKRR